MGKLKLQIAMLALAFIVTVAAKIYVDRYLNGHETRQTTYSDSMEPGAVSLPAPEQKM